MITIITGDDRLAAEQAVHKLLKPNYELFEGENLAVSDLPNIFLGTSLFAESRQILVKDLQDSSAWAELPKYLDTTHTVVIWESKLDKRSVAYKAVAKDPRVTIKDFATPEPTDKWFSFNVYDLAVAGKGKQAVAELDKSIADQDPYMFFGGLIAAATKAYDKTPAPRTVAALKVLAKTDLDLKTTGLDPWLLIKSVLLRLS